MKRKFESSVAQEMPKTKRHEPKLPWKLTTDELERIKSPEDEYKAVTAGSSPLKARAVFLIMLLLAIFSAISYFIISAAVENKNVYTRARNNEMEIVSLRHNIEKASGENAILNENAVRLEQKVGDLAAQKELFTSVIESLTKKSEETLTE